MRGLRSQERCAVIQSDGLCNSHDRWPSRRSSVMSVWRSLALVESWISAEFVRYEMSRLMRNVTPVSPESRKGSLFGFFIVGGGHVQHSLAEAEPQNVAFSRLRRSVRIDRYGEAMRRQQRWRRVIASGELCSLPRRSRRVATHLDFRACCACSACQRRERHRRKASPNWERTQRTPRIPPAGKTSRGTTRLVATNARTRSRFRRL